MFVGIPEHLVRRCFAFQEGPQYCWAACIQMVLRLYGVEREQSEIDLRGNGLNLFGWFPDRGGYNHSFENNFNEIFGGQFRCTSKDGAPDLSNLIDELANNCPVIAGYCEIVQEDQRAHHAVVIYGAECVNYGTQIVVNNLHVADPDQSRGLGFHFTDPFLKSMSAHWFIHKNY
jgi:hypothetical protein